MNKSPIEMLKNKPSVKYGMDDFYGKQTVINSMLEYAEQFKTKWIDVKLKQPEEHQEVIFLIKSKDEFYNGTRAGGLYQKYNQRGNYYEFTTPGIVWLADYWMPMPEFTKP